MRRRSSERSTGRTGQVRLGIRLPPVGEQLRNLLMCWHRRYSDVILTLFELNEQEIHAAILQRRIDVALIASPTIWPTAVSEPLYRERLFAALPEGHHLASQEALDWASLRPEAFLVQGWDDSQTAREFYASFMGSGISFSAHPASKQSILGLVAAGFGVTLATAGQSEVIFPGVVYRPIDETNAWLQVELTWFPEAEDATVGRFIAFMRDEGRSRGLL